MKKWKRNLLLLVAPYLLMVLINESIRPFIVTHNFHYRDVPVMNPLENERQCSWICHHQTTKVCKEVHVKYLKPYYHIVDLPYFAIIAFLHSFGNYGLANIVFLVVGLPLLTWYFTCKALDYKKLIK